MTTSDQDRRRRNRRTLRRRVSDNETNRGAGTWGLGAASSESDSTGKAESRSGGGRRGDVGKARRGSDPKSPPATLVPQSRPAEAKPALAVEPAPLPPPALDEALTATIRRWAKPTTPEELAERGVKRVRSVSMKRMAGLIEKAVNKALIKRTLEGDADEALTLSSNAREEFLRLARTDLTSAPESAETRATSTLDRLRRELTERRRDLSEREQQLASEIDEVDDSTDGAADSQLEEKLRTLFAVHGGTEDHALEHETMDMLLGEVRCARRLARESRREEHKSELGQLERRISKLSVLLEETEDQLRRARAGGTVDEGIESIYDVVQGLEDGDQQFDQKSDLMKCIFEANMALRE